MNSVGVATVEKLIELARAYVFAGLVFSSIFLLFGIQRQDPGAGGLRLGFRIIILPGLCIFWPLFAVRWLRGKGKPTERNAHRVAAAQSSHA